MNPPSPNLVVVCLEGCHGCGKTSVCTELRSRGVQVLDEGFMNMPDYALHPQSLLMETSWVCSWFTRLLKHNAGVAEDAPPRVVFVDRSPFSAVFYASNNTGSLLTPVIQEHIKEMRAVGIEIVTLNLHVDRDMLWKRICARLEEEPERMRFNESSRAWMETTLDFYDSFAWDETVAIGDDTPAAVVTRVMDAIAERCPHATEALATPLKVEIRDRKAERESFSPISIADLEGVAM